MFLKAHLIVFIGSFSVANAQIPFCSGDLCFTRPDNSGKTWAEAQQRCKATNSTLPIIDYRSRQTSFVDALSHFQLNGMDVWLGATASDYGSNNWHWLNGSQYAGTDVQQQGEYYKSYAYIAKRTTEVLAYASPPNASYSYICQYIISSQDLCTNGTGRTALIKENRCYIRYDERLAWFVARNVCLANKGDLASFSQISFLDGIVDYSGSWVGLRHSQWNWQNAVTGLSSDVTYTSWNIGQPNDAAPDCIATDSGSFPNWKDIACTFVYSYICQVFATTSVSTQGTPSTARPTTSSVLSSTSGSRLLRPSSTTTASGPGSDLSSPAPENNYSTKSVQILCKEDKKNDSNVAVGVGIGVPCAVVIVALVITVIIQQREIRKLRSNLKYKAGDSNVLESKEKHSNSQSSTLQTIGNDGEGNMQYEQLQIQSRLQDQREYEQLGLPLS